MKPPLLRRAWWEQMVRLVTQSGCQMLPEVPQGQGGFLSTQSSGHVCLLNVSKGVSFSITLSLSVVYASTSHYPTPHNSVPLVSLILLEQRVGSSKGPLTA